jgi:Helix-turn-helix domain
MSKRPPQLRVVGDEYLAPAPSPRPRPDNMFQYPQESTQAPMRDKLLFTEAMMASGELTGREQRVAFLLTSLWTHTHGCAYPAMQWIADALGLDKRDVGKILTALETKGWFLVEHGTRGRGKNHVNRYRPNVEKVESGTPFKTVAQQAAADRAEQEKVAFCPAKGGKTSTKGGNGATLSGLTLSGVLRTDTDDRRSSSRSQSDEAHAPDISDPNFIVLKKLQGIDAWLKAGSDRALTSTERRTVEGWLTLCDELCESHDAHTGDPIGGMAYRLAQEVSGCLQEDDERRKRTEAEFKQRQAEVLRELEGPAPPTNGGPSGNQCARAVWLKSQLWAKRLSVDDVMETLGVGFADVFDLASGKTALAVTSWNKLADLVASRTNQCSVPEITCSISDAEAC